MASYHKDRENSEISTILVFFPATAPEHTDNIHEDLRRISGNVRRSLATQVCSQLVRYRYGLVVDLVDDTIEVLFSGDGRTNDYDRLL